jgi:hypothetical protein
MHVHLQGRRPLLQPLTPGHGVGAGPVQLPLVDAEPAPGLVEEVGLLLPLLPALVLKEVEVLVAGW